MQTTAQYGINVRDAAKKEAVDRCRMRVTYEFRYATDTLGTRKIDRLYLEVGDSVSRCYSVFGDYIDSLYYRLGLRNPTGAINPRKWMQRDWAERYEDTYIGYPCRGNMRTSIPFVNREFFYDEPVPLPAWRIADEGPSRRILDYDCRRADVSFRGRDYEVWFAEDIPINLGPWKFNGLPGLILCVKERCGLFNWTAIALEQTRDTELFVYNPKGRKTIPGTPPMRMSRITRQQMRKLLRMVWADKVGLHQSLGVRYATFDLQSGQTRELQMGDIVGTYVPELELE